MNISELIAKDLTVKTQQVEKAIQLLDDGATVPFISRYRKEVTGGLDDTQLRFLEERLRYLRELQDRKQTILKSIKDQDKLTDELENAILITDNKSSLEDLYLPYKPKRRSKALIAREAGLEPLALGILQHPETDPEIEATKFIYNDKNINTTQEALEGARFILLEIIAENATLIGYFRQYLWDKAILNSQVAKGKDDEGNKFNDYFKYSEAINKIPSHRALALLRGQREEILQLSLNIDDEQKNACIAYIENTIGFSAQGNPSDAWLQKIINDCWRIKIFLKLEVELMKQLREAAEAEAIKVFAQNLKHLLMAAPAGSHVTMGLDPGLRTGVKTVVVDATGKLLAHTVIFPHAPQNKWDNSLAELARLCKQHKVTLISIGNGTASRKTDKLAKELIKRHPELPLQSLVVSEAGASVYSASEVASNEFPDLDVSYRGAVSIARRLQDPLAELVKIDPKSIGVGQYQHDVNQVRLSRSLVSVMEDCVNAVGVDLNTASAPLLSCVSGLSKSIANNIIVYRNENGEFKKRQELKKVARMGEKAFQQAVGFLRLPNGDNPLDASAVHPESYTIVENIQSKNNLSIREIIGNSAFIKSLDPRQYVNDQFGLPTIKDIFSELEKPGRDPRPEFKTAQFNEEVNTVSDLKVGMQLEGVITNVANFGAFVDIGVHQDGLVHISMLADRFVKDPSEVVKVGDIVKVKVLEVDLKRKRISLSMRSDDAQAPTAKKTPKKQTEEKPVNGTFGNALMDALKR